jgi:hypothetical protein
MAASAGLAGCISGQNSVAADVSPKGWSEPVEMRYVNNDTLGVKQLQLTLRHSANIQSSTGRHVIVTISPSGIATRDTLTINMLLNTRQNSLMEAHATGRRIWMTEPGEWRFVVTPLQNTVGVWSIGLDIK